MIRRAFALSLLASAPAGAQTFDLGEVRPSTAKATAETKPACASDDPQEIVVCGNSRRPYRLDPAVLAQIRASQAAPRAPDQTAALMAQDECTSGIGPKGCTGTPTVDYVAIALLAASAAKKAAEGEDWRVVFRIRPEGYEQYREMRERQAARP